MSWSKEATDSEVVALTNAQLLEEALECACGVGDDGYAIYRSEALIEELKRRLEDWLKEAR